MDLVVIGLGYVGLPLAQEAARVGHGVIGFDLSEERVGQLNEGRSYVDDLSDDDLDAMLRAGFKATTDALCIANADVVVICVPTPLQREGNPDLSAVTSAARSVGHNLTRNTLVVLESTTYPGTTEDVVRPLLESASGMRAGHDFALAYSPERIDPGNRRFTLRNTPKVVGGYTEECLDRAVEFYGTIVDEVVPTVGTREAELSKLLENTYRHVNIALMNEMAIFCAELDVDIWAAIDAASTKPFGFTPFYPGPGVGGHCIPIDPNYLSFAVRSLGYQFRFVELAQEISGRMPAYVATRVQAALNEVRLAVNGARILLLGVAYKANVSDERESPARPLALRLQEMGAEVEYFDPYVEAFDVDGEPLLRRTDLAEAVREADLAVLVQAHDEVIGSPHLAKASLILDTRGVLEGPNVERL